MATNTSMKEWSMLKMGLHVGTLYAKCGRTISEPKLTNLIIELEDECRRSPLMLGRITDIINEKLAHL